MSGNDVEMVQVDVKDDDLHEAPAGLPEDANCQEKILHVLKGETNLSEGTQLRHRMIAEFYGTFFLVAFGIGSVANAVTSGAYAGLWSVASVWGFGVAIAIYTTASVSGAHLNPAVSFALACIRPSDFPWRYFFPYVLAQMGGAIVAGFLNLIVFNGAFIAHANRFGYSRGDDASIMSAMCFGEYFPNPGFRYGIDISNGTGVLVDSGLMWTDETVTVGGAFFIEMYLTAILVFVIFALTDGRNKVLVGSKDMAPFFIGFTVAILIGTFAELTQVGMNPARDLGPRLVAAISGWGAVALPGPRGGFWVYILGPMFGGPIGGALYDFVLGRGLRPEIKTT